MSTGSEPPAGRSTELARSFVARDRDGIRTQNLSRRTCQSRSRVQEAFKARRPSLELSGWAPVRSPGQQSGSRRGGALRGTRVAGPLSPAEGQRRDRRSLASGNNDSSSASARARPARLGRRRRPPGCPRRGAAAPPPRPPPRPAPPRRARPRATQCRQPHRVGAGGRRRGGCTTARARPAAGCSGPWLGRAPCRPRVPREEAAAAGRARVSADPGPGGGGSRGARGAS